MAGRAGLVAHEMRTHRRDVRIRTKYENGGGVLGSCVPARPAPAEGGGAKTSDMLVI